MRDNTSAARMERGLAELQSALVNLNTLIGRLEAVVGSHPSSPGPLTHPEPPVDTDEIPS